MTALFFRVERKCCVIGVRGIWCADVKHAPGLQYFPKFLANCSIVLYVLQSFRTDYLVEAFPFKIDFIKIFDTETQPLFGNGEIVIE